MRYKDAKARQKGLSAYGDTQIMIQTVVTDKDVRDHLGHGKGDRKVRIRRDGEVHYYGSTDAFDRQHDYWHYGGLRSEFVQEILYGRYCLERDIEPWAR